MHITHHTDYALRVLIYLGANEHRLATIQEISERFEVSRSHMMKVVNQLIRYGYVEGLRGKGGGLRLARSPKTIGIGAVVRHMENDLAIVECFEIESKCLLTGSCRLRSALSDALNAFLTSLDRVTLEDLLSPKQHDLLYVPISAIGRQSLARH